VNRGEVINVLRMLDDEFAMKIYAPDDTFTIAQHIRNEAAMLMRESICSVIDELETERKKMIENWAGEREP
jgi:hypothetical protein